MTELIQRISSLIWGVPVLLLLIGGGLYLSVRLRFPQRHIFRIFKSTLKTLTSGSKNGTAMSALQGFSTSLAAAVGTGSVAGVGAALAAGGKGAVFWMWVSAFIGMGISYCENYLGTKYSHQSSACGALAYLEGIGRGRIIALIYAACTVLASLGMGNMAQASSAAAAAAHGFGISRHAAAFMILIFAASAAWGKSSAARLCERLVPIMALIFILGSLWVILSHPLLACKALRDIVGCAFSPRAAAGGALGTVVIEGVRRGAFSNEAGLGSSPAVHSACSINVVEPEKATGTMGMCEVFIDTMVICTLSALVIIVSGVPLVSDSAVTGYSQAMGGFGRSFIGLSLTLFALATIAGWFFIGEKAWSYLTHGKTALYGLIYIICAVLGALYSSSLIWGISDIFNALMAIPNMIGVLCLSHEVKV